MRMLSGLLGLSGLVWVGGPVLLNAMDGGTQSWPLALATFGSPVVIAGTAATFLARTATQVVRSLAVLWLIAVTVGSVSLADSSGPSLAAAGAAVLFVTLAFALWLLFPLLVFSYVRDRTPRGVT